MNAPKATMATQESEEALREACANGNARAVMYYLQNGVRVHSKNGMNGWTALHW